MAVDEGMAAVDKPTAAATMPVNNKITVPPVRISVNRNNLELTRRKKEKRVTYHEVSKNLAEQFYDFLFSTRKIFCCCFGNVTGTEAVEVFTLHLPILCFAFLALLTTPWTWFTSYLIRAYVNGYCFFISLVYLVVTTALHAKANGVRQTLVAAGTGFRDCCTFRRFAAATQVLSFLTHLFLVFASLPAAYSIDGNLRQAFGTPRHLPNPEPNTFNFGEWMTMQLGSHAGNSPANREAGEMARSVVYKNLTEMEAPVVSGTYADGMIRGRSDSPWSRQLHIKYVLPTDVTGDDATSLPPVLFHVHGGGWKYGDSFITFAKVAYFLKRGYAVASVEYRLLGYGYNCMSLSEDVFDALRYIKKHGKQLGMDSDRIVAYGESAGGHLALLAAYRLNLELRSTTGVMGVYNMAGATDIASLVKSDYSNIGMHKTVYSYLMSNTPSAPPASTTSPSASPHSLTRRFLSDDVEAYRTCSPTYWISEYTPPTLSVHGKLDSLVPAPQATRLHNLLDEMSSKMDRRIPHLKVMFPMHDHVAGGGWAGVASQVTRYAVERFFAWSIEREQDLATDGNSSATSAVPYLLRTDDADAKAARERSDTDEAGMSCEPTTACATNIFAAFLSLFLAVLLVLGVREYRRHAAEHRAKMEEEGYKKEPTTPRGMWSTAKLSMRKFTACFLGMLSGSHDFDEFVNKHTPRATDSPRKNSFWHRKDNSVEENARKFASTYVKLHGVSMPISVVYSLGESVKNLEKLAKENQMEDDYEPF
ncbi:alpha/beta hydrolase fold-3 domain-containing protein [Pseudoscourfieldia marina]